MLIPSNFEVAAPADKVWQFFDNIPQVAACLPGAELTKDLGNNEFEGKVAIRMGPVKMEFDGNAKIKDKNDAAKKIVVDAKGADAKGRGTAAMSVTAGVVPTGKGSRVDVDMDLQLSGAAAQFGRGMVADVSAVLMRDFAVNMQNRIAAIDKGLNPDQVASAGTASGLAIGLQAMKMALLRVLKRFFAPYQPNAS